MLVFQSHSDQTSLQILEYWRGAGGWGKRNVSEVWYRDHIRELEYYVGLWGQTTKSGKLHTFLTPSHGDCSVLHSLKPHTRHWQFCKAIYNSERKTEAPFCISIDKAESPSPHHITNCLFGLVMPTFSGQIWTLSLSAGLFVCLLKINMLPVWAWLCRIEK